MPHPCQCCRVSPGTARLRLSWGIARLRPRPRGWALSPAAPPTPPDPGGRPGPWSRWLPPAPFPRAASIFGLRPPIWSARHWVPEAPCLKPPALPYPAREDVLLSGRSCDGTGPPRECPSDQLKVTLSLLNYTVEFLPAQGSSAEPAARTRESGCPDPGAGRASPSAAPSPPCPWGVLLGLPPNCLL